MKQKQNEDLCEVCGQREPVAKVMLEGATVKACKVCKSSGKVIKELGEETDSTSSFSSSSSSSSSKSKREPEEEIVENYSKIIKKAREKRELTIEELGEEIQEKRSYLQALESGRLKPTKEVANKLEKELDIELIEEVKEPLSKPDVDDEGFSEPTLGEIAEEE